MAKIGFKNQSMSIPAIFVHACSYCTQADDSQTNLSANLWPI